MVMKMEVIVINIKTLASIARKNIKNLSNVTVVHRSLFAFYFTNLFRKRNKTER